MYFIRVKDDKANRRWKVREAVSVSWAIESIFHAMASGSIGDKITKIDMTEPCMLPPTIVLADVVQVNSDGTERQPYTTAY